MQNVTLDQKSHWNLSSFLVQSCLRFLRLKHTIYSMVMIVSAYLFLSTIWLSFGQLWAIIEGKPPLT